MKTIVTSSMTTHYVRCRTTFRAALSSTAADQTPISIRRLCPDDFYAAMKTVESAKYLQIHSHDFALIRTQPSYIIIIIIISA